MKTGIKKYFGDKAFYKMAFTIIIPVVIQQLILSIAGYVDNFMINSFSDVAYIGVSTANRFMFLMNFFWIGITAGISVFISQYYGAKNKNKVTATIQLSVIVSVIIGILSAFMMFYLAPYFLKFFISGDQQNELVAIGFGIDYIKIIAIGAVFMLLNFMVATIYRSIGKTKIPLISGIIGIIINVALNFILINGLLGFPALGAKGAAIATIISKVVELIILLVIAILFDKEKYVKRVFTSFEIDSHLFKMYLIKGIPIILNEVLWAIGIQILAKLITGGNYDWLLSFNYSQNVADLFLIYYSGIATGTAILVGTALGEGDFEKAKDYSRKLIGITAIASVLAIILLLSFSPLFLLVLTPVNEIYWTAYHLILINALFIVVYGFNATIYFTLRAGGDSIRAFLLDQLPTYLVGIPVTFLLYKMEYKWQLGLLIIFASSKIIDIIKVFFATYFYKKETWIQNLTVTAPSLIEN